MNVRLYLGLFKKKIPRGGGGGGAGRGEGKKANNIFLWVVGAEIFQIYVSLVFEKI